MFRITEGPSSGSLVQSLAKNYKKGKPFYTVNYTNAQRVRICCHNTDLVHASGHDRIILVIFSAFTYSELHTRTTGQNMLP